MKSRYKLAYVPNHPNATKRGQVIEHILIAEKALGKPLPPGAEVHHVDENKANNRNDNLVICPNHAYHQLLHLRMRALCESGNPNYRRCHICKAWDNPDNMRCYFYGRGNHYMHPACTVRKASRWNSENKARRNASYAVRQKAKGIK